MLLAVVLLRYDIRITPGFEELKIRAGGKQINEELLFLF
jgi:hypothetical protein